MLIITNLLVKTQVKEKLNNSFIQKKEPPSFRGQFTYDCCFGGFYG